jgi:hypothetical protein
VTRLKSFVPAVARRCGSVAFGFGVGLLRLDARHRAQR